jgi:hypothetical protein
VTVAPGTTDPDWSFTVPTIDPNVDWANADMPDDKTQASKPTSARLQTLEPAIAHLQKFCNRR